MLCAGSGVEKDTKIIYSLLSFTTVEPKYTQVAEHRGGGAYSPTAFASFMYEVVINNLTPRET